MEPELQSRFQSITDNTVGFYTHHLQENNIENTHKNPMLKKKKKRVLSCGILLVRLQKPNANYGGCNTDCRTTSA